MIFRQKIVEDIVESGGDFITGFVSGENSRNPNSNTECYLFRKIAFQVFLTVSYFFQLIGAVSVKRPENNPRIKSPPCSTISCILEFPAPKKLTTRNAVRDKQTTPSPFIELTN